jgi:putative hydrolase of HD superfamily
VRFQEPDLYGELISRVVLGNTVIDHEQVRRNFEEGVGSLEVACIYEIIEGKIRRAWFISGEKTLGMD